jgi:hypothetical protein
VPEQQQQSIYAFLYSLREADFLVTPMQLVSAQKILVALANVQAVSSPEQIKSHLAPLFSFSPEQQELFNDYFNRWWENQKLDVITPLPRGINTVVGDDTTGNGISETSDDDDTPPKWWRKRNFIAAAVLVWVLLITALTSIYFQQIRYTPKVKTLTGVVRDTESKQPVVNAEIQFAGQITQSQADGQFSFDYEALSDEPRELSVTHPVYEPLNIPIDTTDNAPIEILLKRVAPLITDVVNPPKGELDEIFRIVWEWLLILVAAAPLIIFGLWLLWRLWRRRQLKHWRDKHKPNLRRIKVKRGESQLYLQSGFLKLAREMRRHRHVVSNNLEPERTVEETIRAGNFFTPIYASRRLSPEYLILIDRASYVDQHASLADEITNRLKKQGVFIERYFFDGSPHICWREGANEKFFDLSALAAKYYDNRLLIFSDGAGFFEPVFNRPRVELLKLISAWEIRTLLATNAANPFHQWTLEKFGLPVIQAHESELNTLLEIINPSETPKINRGKKNIRLTKYAEYPVTLRKETNQWWMQDIKPQATDSGNDEFHKSDKVEALKIELQYYLGTVGYELLCACAVYPEMLWDLSFYLAHHLVPPDEREETLENLVCLPWFRSGKMPGWLRSYLLESLPAEREAHIRQLIEQLLISYVQNPQRGFQLEIASQAPKNDLIERLRARFKKWRDKNLLYDLIKTEPRDSPLQDHVFIDFLSKNRLAFVIPRLLEQTLRLSAETALKWHGIFYKILERFVSGFFNFLRGFYRRSNPLYGLSWLKMLSAPVAATLLSILLLSMLPAITLLIIQNIPNAIASKLPETLIDVKPPFPLPTVTLSITPTPDITTPTPQSSTPTVSPGINPTPSLSPTGSPIITQTPTPETSPGFMQSLLAVAFVDDNTGDLITNGRLVVHVRDRSDDTEGNTQLLDKQFDGSSSINFILSSGYYVFIASAPGYVTNTSPVRLSGDENVPLNIRLRKIDNLTPTPTTVPNDCPSGLKVTARPGKIQLDENTTFTANVNTNARALTYSWSVAGGTIMSGQGTSAIVVGDFSKEGTYSATVTIGIANPAAAANLNCQTTASATVNVVDDGEIAPLFDSVGPAASGEIKARLDNLFAALNNDPSAQGYIINYGNLKDKQYRIKTINDYIKARKFDKTRVVMLNGGGASEILSKFYIVSAGMPPPVP